jgi:two-component system cell cycle sensor histidine kinase/response regulator CckA
MPPDLIPDAIPPGAAPPPVAPRLWPRIGGPLLTLLTLAGIAALAETPWRAPNPGLILLVPAVYAAYIGGFGPGLVSAGISLLFAAFYLSQPGRPFRYSEDDAFRMIGIGLAMPAITLMVGLLKHREQKRAAAEGAARAGLRYRELVDDIDGVVWEADASAEPLRMTFVSSHAEALLGYPPTAWLTVPGCWPGCIHPEDRDRVLEFARVTAAGRLRQNIDYRVVTVRGETVWVRDTLHGLAAEEGRGPRLRGIMVDITGLRQAEKGLTASAAREGAILEGALDCIVTIDPHGNITDFNPAAERTFGYRRSEVIGLPMAELIVPPGFRAAHRLGLQRHLATGETHVIGRRIELTAMRADGSEFPVELSITRIPGLESPMFAGFIRDITERRAADANVRGALSLVTATLESTADGLLVVDAAGKIVSFNRKFAGMWRIPQEILDARDDDRAIAFVLSQLAAPDSFVAKVRELYAQPDAESFDVLTFRDGRVFERYSKPQRIDGRSVGRVWSFRDVTERNRAAIALRESEDQLRQSQKMDAIGRLAGGVAHDFNNLLTVILGYTEQMLERLDPREPLRTAALEIQGAAERAAGLTRQLLAFSRKQVLEPRLLDLNAVLSGTSGLLRRLISEDVQLDVRLDPDLGRVIADEHQIQQVIMNLAINARDAMPQGGRLTLSTSNETLDESYALQHLPLAPGEYVLLTVADTGVGMDAATRARAFEPFFTTKEPGKGTGLGLATVYGIIQQSGGYIWVYSEPGHGTVFKIYLPREDAAPDAGAPRATGGAALNGHETVLLVEDEASVRELLRNTLHGHGYRVLAAASGEQALERASAHRGPIHLLVSDVVMPGIGGPEVAARLSSLHPELRVLHISGYADDAILRHGVSEGTTAFLQKPFTLEALARKMREVLDAPRPVSG